MIINTTIKGAGGGGGGGAGGSMSDPIRFFDYDGTLVASYTSVPSALPAVPTHDKLTNGTWNYTLAQVTTQFNAMGTCDVGANYDTVSGDTEIDIVLPPGRLSPIFTCTIANGSILVDWGDGTAKTKLWGWSINTRVTSQHTYAQPGAYTIKVHAETSDYSIYGGVLIGTSGIDSDFYRNCCIKSARIGGSCTFGMNAFSNCYSLVSVSIPSSVTSILNEEFYNCSALASVSIPSSVTTIGDKAFYYCYSLASASIPNSVMSIGSNVFERCYSLSFVTIPSGVTSISGSTFYYCSSLSSVTIPSSVTSIGSAAFQFCSGMSEIHILAATPPTLSNTNAFSNIPSDCKIYVPSASLNTYKAAQNWSTYASKMVGE